MLLTTTELEKKINELRLDFERRLETLRTELHDFKHLVARAIENTPTLGKSFEEIQKVTKALKNDSFALPVDQLTQQQTELAEERAELKELHEILKSMSGQAPNDGE